MKNSDHNQNLVWKELESLRYANAKSGLFSDTAARIQD